MTDDKTLYKNILVKLLKISVSDSDAVRSIIDQLFDDEDFEKQAENICQAYIKPEYRNSTLKTKPVSVQALKELIKICKREKIGIIPFDILSTDEDEEKEYDRNDKITVFYLSLQESLFNECLLEAYAKTGAVVDIKRDYMQDIFKKVGSTNAVLEINGVSAKTYEGMKKKMEDLPDILKFTMFPKMTKDGKVDVGFFTKTSDCTLLKHGIPEKTGPYVIPKIASVLLASSLLEEDMDKEEYEKEEEKKRKLEQEIVDWYYEADDFYAVPAKIIEDGRYEIFPEEVISIDESETSKDGSEYEALVESYMKHPNTIVIPMTPNEYEKFNSEHFVSESEIEFIKGREQLKYQDIEKSSAFSLAERLINILNKKREQIMLASDDFNSKNLENLENYISGSVQEFIVREDADYSDVAADKEEIETELKLLNKLDKNYTMSYVEEGHDKVTELIDNERKALGMQPVERSMPVEKETTTVSYERS